MKVVAAKNVLRSINYRKKNEKYYEKALIRVAIFLINQEKEGFPESEFRYDGSFFCGWASLFRLSADGLPVMLCRCDLQKYKWNKKLND